MEERGKDRNNTLHGEESKPKRKQTETYVTSPSYCLKTD
jgi:hypothetical protein